MITALAALVTAIAPIVGAFLSHKLKMRELELNSENNIEAVSSAHSMGVSENFIRLILSCIVIFACTGAATALMGVADSHYKLGGLFLEKDIAWIVGNCTVLVLAVRHAIYSK